MKASAHARLQRCALLGAILASVPLLRASDYDMGNPLGKKLLYITKNIGPWTDELEYLKKNGVPSGAILEEVVKKFPRIADKPGRQNFLETRLAAGADDDKRSIGFFEELGFQVKVGHDKDPIDFAKGVDLIVISEFVSAEDTQDKDYKHIPVPILCLENDLYGVLNMTKKRKGNFGEYGDLPGDEKIFLTLVNAPHPLSAGLPAGSCNWIGGGTLVNYGKPAPGAIIIAHIQGHPEMATIFAYDKGQTMDAEFIAPARRIAFPQRRFKTLHPEGKALYAAALKWAVAQPPGPWSLAGALVKTP